jgi:hypothetical protein
VTGGFVNFRNWAALGGSVFLSGCALLKADPAPDSGYIPHPEQMSPWPERADFVQRIWFKDEKSLYATRSRFTKICFLPTRIDFLQSPGWWDSLNAAGRDQYKKDVSSMANYLDTTLKEVFQSDPSKRFVLTDKPDENTVVYEFAIVELHPTKVAVNAAGTALDILVPGGGVVKSVAKGSIAVEVAARDGRNNDLLLTWADREIDTTSPFSFRVFPNMHMRDEQPRIGRRIC